MPFAKLFPQNVPTTLSSGLCKCDGACPGYGTRGNCPPLIVLASLAMEQVQSAQAVITRLVQSSTPGASSL